MDLLILRDLDPKSLERKYQRVLTQLCAGDFRSAEVKKLRGAPYYRARLDDSSRLLFTFGEHAQQRCLLVLEVIRNHAYDKARFLRGGSYKDEDFLPWDGAAKEAALPPLNFVNPASPSFHYLDKPLSFDAAQEEVYQANLPLILIGPAGSGKTALTLEKLKTLAGHGLYVTRSAFLVENARTLYHSNGYANDGQEVEFLSLDELVGSVAVPTGREATFKDFQAWFARMQGNFKLREAHKIFEEIRGVITGMTLATACLSEAAYLELGVRQSIFLGDERRDVYRIFQRWTEAMASSGLYEPNIVAWERLEQATAQYDFLVVDEVQDLTNVQLALALRHLRAKDQFLLCGDSNQIVHPNLFSWSKVRSLFYQDAAAAQEIRILKANYRNTQAVTAIANRLLLLKQVRFGSIDRDSNYLVDCVSQTPGRVDLLPDSAALRQELDAKTRRSTRFAVVVLRDEQKVAAKAAFATPLIFTVQEAKGLEYENVILFNLVSSAPKEFRACCEGVSDADLLAERQYARTKDKTDKSLDAYKFYVNSLYVAMTRAVKSLIIVEDQPDEPLWRLLAVEATQSKFELANAESSKDEWRLEAQRLELQGKAEQAAQIRREILQMTPVPWLVVEPANLMEIRAKATRPTNPDKAMQQLLFEYALTYDAPGFIAELVEAKFKHARQPESGRAFIETAYYSDYKLKNPVVLPQRTAKHGVDFRNALNETPLMVAAKLGRADLVRTLLTDGADPSLVDNAGRDAVRLVLSTLLRTRQVKPEALSACFQALAVRPIVIKVDDRLYKLEPRSMEWFLLNFVIFYLREQLVDCLVMRRIPAIKATWLEGIVQGLPEGVLAANRKKRTYISAMLAKNEVMSGQPYGKKFLYRLQQGYYTLNPRLEIQLQERWLGIDAILGVEALAAGLGPQADLSFYRENTKFDLENLQARLKWHGKIPRS